MPEYNSDLQQLPQHVGIIMDGNGRWASSRGMPRTFGHQEGVKAAKRIVKAASELGIKYISLYVFSTENWKRKQEEVSFVMGLIKEHLKKELDFYRENNIRVVHSGDISGLGKEIRAEIEDVIRDTASYQGLTVNLAINYGGRNEIVRAVNRWVQAKLTNQTGRATAPDISLTELTLSRYLDQPDLPDPDLIIRTAGERRTSNFLLWESAYAELYFSPYLWPEWDKEKLMEALHDYQKRERKFGGLK